MRQPRRAGGPGETAIVNLDSRGRRLWGWFVSGPYEVTGFRKSVEARDDAFAHGYEFVKLEGRVDEVRRKVLTRDEWRKTTALERLTCEQYDVMYDEPDERGEFGRRLVEIYEVTFDCWKNSHDLVMRRHMELHPHAVGVRVVYA